MTAARLHTTRRYLRGCSQNLTSKSQSKRDSAGTFFVKSGHIYARWLAKRESGFQSLSWMGSDDYGICSCTLDDFGACRDPAKNLRGSSQNLTFSLGCAGLYRPTSSWQSKQGFDAKFDDLVMGGSTLLDAFREWLKLT